MSEAAERVRMMTLKRQADAAAARAGTLGEELQRIWDGDGEPPVRLVAEFEGACAEAERLLLEYSLGGTEAAESNPEMAGITPGQVEYEKFCVEEWRHGRLWNIWAGMRPEDKGEWEASAMLYRPPTEQ